MEGLCTKILVTRRSLRKMVLKRRQVEAGRLATELQMDGPRLGSLWVSQARDDSGLENRPPSAPCPRRGVVISTGYLES